MSWIFPIGGASEVEGLRSTGLPSLVLRRMLIISLNYAQTIINLIKTILYNKIYMRDFDEDISTNYFLCQK